MKLKVPFLAGWPWGSVLLHWRERRVSAIPLPSHRLQGASEQVKKKHRGLQLFNQSLRLHILISYFQAINRRPTAGFPPLQKISLYILNHGSKKRFRETASQLVPREPYFPQNNQRKKMRKAFFRDNITCDVFAYRVLISPELPCVSPMDAWRTTKWSILNERLRNLDPAVLVSLTVDIYLLKKQTGNAQPLNLLITIDGERTAKRENSLLNRANKV